MNQTGIYEQLITQLIAQNLNRETFHIGERQLEANEAATWLSRFLTHIIECAMDSAPQGNNRVSEQKYLKLINVKLDRHYSLPFANTTVCQ